MNYIESVQHAASYIQEKLDKIQAGTIAIVTGSGLGGLVDGIAAPEKLPYTQIPGFPVSTVQGHAGTLVQGHIEGTPVIAMDGRVHLYEGFSPREVTFGVRALHEAGVRTIILTNAAGALNPGFEVGTPMLISDHINFMVGMNPLRGTNNDAWGPRFPDMSCVYDVKLRTLAMQCALKQGMRLETGTYMGVMGPTLETPAETRMYRIMGADAIGMSTVPEAIAAHHMGMRVLGLSCLTNKNLPDCIEEVTHEQVLEQAARSSKAMTRLVLEILKNLD
ncbi:purine-nucleoside phosphorylase [Pseudodesulfovibrio senegalensis]|uniref:Purine nucleoside phosphorylase n=1 Tax=Pseudodesulfovibrio senegalensis TaxID=1721087 RepID=A0A6N6MZ15_9BACT|nr:purine-nucleoside phosphorylase [Pseudodesulfovibrio senegalensis]KAB1440320.1 purine-nucleoside phosphorylase [Pseudodesulfovibrio senegalensis]